MTLIDDDEVILVDRRNVGGLLCKEYPLYQALNRADMDLGFGFWLEI